VGEESMLAERLRLRSILKMLSSFLSLRLLVSM